MSKDNEKTYKGKSGQLYVMSELLMRGWNVAIPEVDTGDDIFVVKDLSGDLRKMQVKTTYTVEIIRNGFKVKFNIPSKQLRLPQEVEIIYALVIRKENKWVDKIIIIQREVLEKKLSLIKKNIKAKNINLYLKFEGNNVFAQSENFNEHVNDFSAFPIQF